MASRDDLSNNFLNSDAISDDYFIEIVENKLNIKRDTFKLRLVLLSPATGKNENYLAVLFRAKILIEVLATKERKSVDVIIKALLSIIPEFKEMGVFPRERFMYQDVISSFEQIWLERTGEVIKFGPKSIKFETDPYEQIVLDDLKVEGFVMQNRKIGLTMDQTKMVLAKLAKFHAASLIRYQKEGIIKTWLDRKASMPPFAEDNPFTTNFAKMFHSFVGFVRSYGNCDAYADKMMQWDPHRLINQWTEVAAPMKSGFQVLNHGDMWLNNMMFRSDEAGNPLDVSLIDYQIPFWGSPSGDILYFLLTSVADDIKVDNFDYFVEFYHSEFIEDLKQLKYDQPAPTLAELHDDMREKGGFAASCIMMILSVVKYDSPEELSIEVLMAGGDDEEMKARVYNNENFRKAVKLWLPFIDKRGFLDALIKK